VWPQVKPMIELGALLLLGLVLVGLVCAAGVIVKAVFWLVFLPIRLVFWVIGSLVFLPILLLKLIFGGILFLILLPILAIVTVAVAASVLIPAIPVLLLIGLIWLLTRPQPTALARQ
jgi:hypothetical protein